MSIDMQAEATKLYNEGYDDGLNGYGKANMDADYLQGYYDGQEEAEETNFDYYDYDYDYDYDED